MADPHPIDLLRFSITLFHKNRFVHMIFRPSEIHKGSWQWEARGKDGEEDSKEKAIASARTYVLNS